MSSKIVVIGDVNGRISEVFSKLAKLHEKQSFAFAIIAGDLFAEHSNTSDSDSQEVQQLLDGAITVPLPTYFSLGRRTLPTPVVERLESTHGELCENLTILGRKVSIKTSEGFRILAVGGAHTDHTDGTDDHFPATYRDADVESLATANGLTEADILVTSDWPAHIRDGSKAKLNCAMPESIQSLGDLATVSKPRYHFSTSDGFFEREPFFHPGPSPRSITRFLSLAPYGNPAKQKWIYAFSLEPSAPPPTQLPAECTASPLASAKKRKLDHQADSYNNFRYANGNGNQPYEREYGRHKRQRNQPPPRPEDCYFCLSNPKCETHMIASIGDDVYVTIAKGPLTMRSSFSSLGFPGHILLIPLQHAPTIASIAEEDAKQKTVTELQRYRDALHKMLVEKSKSADGRSQLGAVTWEISRGGGVHLHWQFLPVPVDLIQRGLVEAAFDVEAENSSYPKFVKGAKEMEEAEEGDFLKVMIWSEALRKDIVLPLDKSFRFDLQFGRRVLGKLLGLESRTHWRDCAQTQAEEEADATALKEAFKEFDISLEG